MFTLLELWSVLCLRRVHERFTLLSLGTSHVPLAFYAGEHACALFEGGQVRRWHNNDRGQLGLGGYNCPRCRWE